MNIHIPQAANDNPLNTPNITRLRTTVANQIQKHIVNPRDIKKYNEETIQEYIGDIQDFSIHFSRYLEAEGFSSKICENDLEIIRIFLTFLEWKSKNNHLLEHHSIVGNLNSIHQKIGTIQELLLNKLGVQDDVIENTAPWDRIAWEIEKIKAA